MRLPLANLRIIVAVVAVLVLAGPAFAQGPGIGEIERLVRERETEITRLEARLGTLERHADSLGQAKRGTPAGSPQYETLSNQILSDSQQITTVARQLRVLYEQVRDLKTELFVAYNGAIPGIRGRIETLTNQGRTPENSRELRSLIEQLEASIRSRERLAGEIEEAQDDLFLPQITLDPRDTPAQLRVKEAIARDAVDKIDARIVAIEGQTEKALQKKRDLEEIRRLREDIELWGDRQAARGGSEIEAILQGRNPAGARSTNVLEDPDARIQELQRRRLELLDRRAEFLTKARLFAQRLQELYR